MITIKSLCTLLDLSIFLVYVDQLLITYNFTELFKQFKKKQILTLIIVKLKQT